MLVTAGLALAEEAYDGYAIALPLTTDTYETDTYGTELATTGLTGIEEIYFSGPAGTDFETGYVVIETGYTSVEYEAERWRVKVWTRVA